MTGVVKTAIGHDCVMLSVLGQGGFSYDCVIIEPHPDSLCYKLDLNKPSKDFYIFRSILYEMNIIYATLLNITRVTVVVVQQVMLIYSC